MTFVRNIHARVWKWDENHKSTPLSNSRLIDVGDPVGWGILARYYKGFCGSGESCVVVQFKEKQQ